MIVPVPVPDGPLVIYPCRGCASKWGVPGGSVVADVDAAIAVGLLVSPHRERLSGSRRRQAQVLHARFANVPRAPGPPPAGEPCVLVTSELCPRCSAALAELYSWPGPAAVFVNSACAPLARLIDPNRAPLNADDQALVLRFQVVILAAIDRMFERLHPGAFRGQEDEP